MKGCQITKLLVPCRSEKAQDRMRFKPATA